MGFCPNCGNEMNGTICERCGYGINTVNKKSGTNLNLIVSIICFAVAGVILLLSIVAFANISKGAANLQDLRSVAGDTVAEAYYNECGRVYSGFGIFVIIFGLFASGSLSCFGIKTLKNKEV